MKEKVLKGIIVIGTLITLVMSNLIFVGTNIVYALYEELETQGVNTDNRNVQFDAYFKDGEGNKIHSMMRNIKDNGVLYFNVTVKDAGVLNDAVIKIQNANFVLEKVESNYIKDINLENNEIHLNSIVYGNSVEIGIPIKFQKSETVKLDLFNMENIISLSGNYKDSDKEEKTVTGEVKTRLLWTEEVNILLEQNVEKYIQLEDKSILQTKITSQVENNVLPKKSEIITTKVPELEGNKVQEIRVLINGKEISNYKLDETEETLIINMENQVNESNEIKWKTGKDVYTIIYVYAKEAYKADAVIDTETEVITQVYTKEAVTKNIQKQEEINLKGNIVSGEITSTQSIYKGYMYAGVTNETTYQENIKIEISDSDATNEINVQNISDDFLDTNNNKLITNGSVIYKNTKINKQEMLDILGQTGSITIYKNGTEELVKINKDSETNEQGYVTVEYTDTNAIKVSATKPEKEGTIGIINEKAIKGVTGYTRKQLKTITSLESKIQVSSNNGNEENVQKIELMDTVTKSTLNISNNVLSTLQTNEGVKIGVTLITNENKYDLYKNPSIKVILPQEIETINVNSINKLFSDEMKVKEAYLKEENGQKVIVITFEGEQTNYSDDISKGMQVIIDADITFNKLTPSKKSEIKVIYTNENGNEASYEEKLEIDLKSKHGALVYNKLISYNEENEIIETIDEQIVEGKLNINSIEKIAEQSIIVVNNYSTKMENIEFVIELPDNKEEVINEKTLKNTIDTQFTGNVVSSIDNVTILYSKDGETWTNEQADANLMKVALGKTVIEPQEQIEVKYNFKIPAQLEARQSAYINTKTSYTNEGNNLENISVMLLSTDSQVFFNNIQAVDVEETEDLTVSTVAISGGKQLANDEEIKEGQTIRYEVTIKNNKTEDVTNLKLIAAHTNAIFFGEVEAEAVGQENNIYIREIPELKEKQLTVGTLQAGESVTLKYEFTVNKQEGDTTKGQIKISADNIEEITIDTIGNKIIDAELKLTVLSLQSENYELISESTIEIGCNIKNLLDVEQKNILLEINLPNIVNFNTEDLLPDENVEFIEYNETENKLKLKIKSLVADEEEMIGLSLIVKEIDLNLEKQDFIIYYTATTEGDNQYISNELVKKVSQSGTKLDIRQTGSAEAEYVKEGDKIVYTTVIKNEGVLEDEIEIADKIPDGLIFNNAYIIDCEGNRQDISELDEFGIVRITTNMKSKGEVTFIVETTVNEEKVIDYTITNVIEVAGFHGTASSNEVVYKVEEKQPEVPVDPDIPTDPDNPVDPDNPDIPGDPDQPSTPEEEKQIISGSIWNDKNKNGLREISEELISNLTIRLINVENGKIEKTLNSTDGKYEFADVEKGKYYVVFEYDTSKYRVAEYQKEGISETQNSDAISKNVKIDGQEKIVAMTDTIEVIDAPIINIDLGLIENEIFDMALDKYISRIIIQNKQGTTVREYSNTQLAKVDIDAKYLANSTVMIEYTLRILNQGEMDGYINEIIDYIPNDLKFSEELNEGWYRTSDGTLHNTSISSQKIAAGESKLITLTLTKTMTSENTGLIVNRAEIVSQSNDLGIQDRDSIPGNNKQGEDDISTAEVLISIKTGATTIIVSIVTSLALVVMIISTVYIIKKRKEV